MATLRAATRGSALARRQTDEVAELLAPLGVGLEPIVVQTAGDRRGDVPIWEVGGQGVFVKEVQAAVIDGAADIAVHSAKDLPSSPAAAPAGLVIAAVPRRADPRDALVGSTLEALRVGARVGTGSVRRRAQLAGLRPDLTFGSLRGNIDTRLAKAAGFDAIVVAAAALARLDRLDAVAELLDPELVVPQVAQGALAVECRAEDASTRALLDAIDHRPSRLAVEAERAWLAELGGGCDLPVGAHATLVDGTRGLRLTAVLASLDGRVVVRVEDRTAVGGLADIDAARALGRRLARHLLDRAGGRRLLEDLPA